MNIEHLAGVVRYADMSVEQLWGFVQQAGIGGVFALMWWMALKDRDRERNERLRLQGIIEGYLPVVQAQARVNSAMSRVVTGSSAVESAAQRETS